MSANPESIFEPENLTFQAAECIAFVSDNQTHGVVSSVVQQFYADAVVRDGDCSAALSYLSEVPPPSVLIVDIDDDRRLDVIGIRPRSSDLLVMLGQGRSGFEAIGSVDLNEVPLTVAAGDLDDDGAVNGTDIGLLLADWGPCDGCPGDLNEDGIVNGTDLGILLAHWTG